MIISVENLKKHIDCGSTTDDVITTKLEAIEAVIRRYTNNNFQQRAIRFSGHSSELRVYGTPQFISIGDTVQISQSNVNDGLYQVTDVGADYVQVDRYLLTTDHNVVTKIVYPTDVVQCAIDLYEWKQKHGGKVGVKSETISRHSVTYEDSATLFMGYPVGILNGLALYKKARC
jgi:hypothetical protein